MIGLFCKSSIPQDSARISSASGQPQRRTAIGRGREEYIRLVLDSVDEQDNESTAENRSMLAFFDSLVHRESLGDLGDAMDDSSESLDSDDVAVTAGRARSPRTVNFERWSDVQSSGDEDDRMVRRSRGERSSSSGGESEESSDNNPLPHPANGVISRLRRKMKYR